jgi:anti-sigma regulatory factor (Ser/Thr protein kinase)
VAEDVAGTGGDRALTSTHASDASLRYPLGGSAPAEWHTGPVDQSGAIDQTVSGFHHSTLFYADQDEFLRGSLPFVNEAVELGEPVLVAVSKAKIDILKQALGSKSGHVQFADMKVLGRNPARIIPAWRRFLAEHTPDQRAARRGIGEPIWAGRSSEELEECERHEALLNVAFAEEHAWQLLCPYDLNALDEQVIEAARRSHPFVTHDGVSLINDDYLAQMPDPFEGLLPKPSAQPRELAFTQRELGKLRRFVSGCAGLASLDGGRTDDLVLAVNELATNSVRHGGGSGTLRIWTDADTLLCEVQDQGRITEPLVGRNPPQANQLTGRGLWVVNQLCDLVQIRSTSKGSVVRVHMRLT